jgi:Fur family ferric uptake transcriptional regulator
VIEFNDELIEAQQKLVAEHYGISLSNHSLFLYGKPIDGQCNHKKDKLVKKVSRKKHLS